jgi:SAM-dependent methyltransferase
MRVSYRELYEKADSVVGWDFSKIDERAKVYGAKWDFLEVVKEYLTNESVLLDIGTGGGKKLLKLAKFTKEAYGIDNSRSMIETAKRNLEESKVTNTEFRLARAEKLPFSDGFFDIIMCRQAPFYASEVFRALKARGVFLTQQVAENDKQNIKDIFGRGQGFGEQPGAFMKQCIQELKSAGFKILRKDTYNATEYYADMADFMFLLRNTPMIPDFDVEKDERYLTEFEKRYKTKDGVKTNSARFLIICQKPERTNL